MYFVSYSRTDSKLVLKMVNELRKAGAELWLDQIDIKTGDLWDKSVEAALKSSTGIIAVLSPDAVDSEHFLNEVFFGLDHNKKVVPVIAKSCEVPLRLWRYQHTDFTSDFQQGLADLARALNLSLSPEPLPSSPPPTPTPAPLPDSLARPTETSPTPVSSKLGGFHEKAILLFAVAGLVLVAPFVSGLEEHSVLSSLLIGAWVGLAGLGVLSTDSKSWKAELRRRWRMAFFSAAIPMVGFGMLVYSESSGDFSEDLSLMFLPPIVVSYLLMALSGALVRPNLHAVVIALVSAFAFGSLGVYRLVWLESVIYLFFFGPPIGMLLGAVLGQFLAQRKLIP